MIDSLSFFYLPTSFYLMSSHIVLPCIRVGRNFFASMSSQFEAKTKKHRTRVVSSTPFRHRQTPFQNKTNFEPHPMLLYAEAECQYIGRSKRHQYCGPLVKIWRTLNGRPIQMLSSHLDETRVDLGCKYTHFFQYRCLWG